MNISAFFVKRPIGTSLLAIGLFLLGLSVWRLLPVAPLPQVDFQDSGVCIVPGGSPKMASNVELRSSSISLNPPDTITSTSSLGSMSSTLHFVEPQHRFSASSCAPLTRRGIAQTTAVAPTYRKVNPAIDQFDHRIAFGRSALDRCGLAERVANRLARLEYINFPARKARDLVQIDPPRSPPRLALEVPRATRPATSNARVSFDGADRALPCIAMTNFSTGAWNDVIVAYRNGAPIRLRDIGKAVNGPENTKSAAWTFAGAGAGPDADTLANGKSIFLAVFKQPGANVIDTVDRIKQALPKIQTAIPPWGVRLGSTATDRSASVATSFTLV